MRLDWKSVLSYLIYVFVLWLTSVLTEKIQKIHVKHPEFSAFRCYRKNCKKRIKEEKR